MNQPTTKREAQSIISINESAAQAARRSEAKDRAGGNTSRAARHAEAAARYERRASDMRALLPTLPE